MTDRIRIALPLATAEDGDSFTIDAFFEDRASDSPSPPGSVDYRIDDVTDPTTPILIKDWTPVEAGDSVSIAIESSSSAILTSTHPFELKQITIAADRGETFQCSIQATWKVLNQNLA